MKHFIIAGLLAFGSVMFIWMGVKTELLKKQDKGRFLVLRENERVEISNIEGFVNKRTGKPATFLVLVEPSPTAGAGDKENE